MDTIARLITLAFDALVLPFGSHRTLALVVLSLVSGAALALVFHATSRPERIKRARDRFQARVLEMRLYPDDVVLLTRALWGALATQLDYFRAAAKPILVVLVLALPIFFQVEARFAARPLRVNERALVTATLKPVLSPLEVPAELSAAEGIAVDARALRIPASREIVWRVEPKAPASHELTVQVFDVPYRFPLQGRENARALGPKRSGSVWDAFVHPGLPSIPDNSALASVRISYPDAEYHVLGARMGWLAVFLLGTLVGGVIPTWILRIQL